MSQITRTACLVALSASVAPDCARAQEIGWEANGRDLQGTRYLPAREITRENVHRLELAWTYRTGEADARFATRRKPRSRRRRSSSTARCTSARRSGA